jgi:hypothetical protein
LGYTLHREVRAYLLGLDPNADESGVTALERLIASHIALDADDETRNCRRYDQSIDAWVPTVTVELLTEWTGSAEGSVSETLRRLGKRGLELRKKAGEDRNGKPVYAHKGHATEFYVPLLATGQLALIGRHHFEDDPASAGPESDGLTDLPPRRTALYFHFDADDVLLYIGITEVLVARGDAHAARSSWVEFAVRAEVRWYGSRRAAEQAEIDAIRERGPLFNDRSNRPEVKQQLVNYLISRRRTDLLAPAVSRG